MAGVNMSTSMPVVRTVLRSLRAAATVHATPGMRVVNAPQTARCCAILAAASSAGAMQPAGATGLSSGSVLRWRGFSAAAAAAATSSVEVPSMGDSITEGTIAAVLKSVGDSVEADEIIAQIETDKVTIDVKAPVSGVLKEVLVAEEDTVIVGQNVATIEEGATATAAATPKEAPQEKAKAAEPAKAAAPPPPPPPAKKAPAPAAAESPVSAAGSRGERVVPMKRMRKRVAERLKDAQNTYAMLSTFNEVDMTNLTEMR